MYGLSQPGARNFLVVLHDRVDTVLALYNIQTARKWVRRFLYTKGFQMKIWNLLIEDIASSRFPNFSIFIGLVCKSVTT